MPELTEDERKMIYTHDKVLAVIEERMDDIKDIKEDMRGNGDPTHGWIYKMEKFMEKFELLFTEHTAMKTQCAAAQQPAQNTAKENAMLYKIAIWLITDKIGRIIFIGFLIFVLGPETVKSLIGSIKDISGIFLKPGL